MKAAGHTVKGVIFDVDGTLLDSVKAWLTVSSNYIRSQGLVPEEGLDERIFSMSMGDGAAYLAKRYGLDKTSRQIIEEIDGILLGYYCKQVQLRDGVRELLEWIRRKEIPMAVATATDEPLIEGAFARLGIRSFFRKIFTCSQVGEGKRSPLIYKKAAECLGTDPEETLVFEDALFALKTAKTAGFLTAGVYESHCAPEQPEIMSVADLYGRNLREILDRLKMEETD